MNNKCSQQIFRIFKLFYVLAVNPLTFYPDMFLGIFQVSRLSRLDSLQDSLVANLIWVLCDKSHFPARFNCLLLRGGSIHSDNRDILTFTVLNTIQYYIRNCAIGTKDARQIAVRVQKLLHHI